MKSLLILTAILFIGCGTKEIEKANLKLEENQKRHVEYLENSNKEYQKDLSRMLDKSIDHLGEASKNKNRIIYIEPVSKYTEQKVYPSNYNNIVNEDVLQKTYIKLQNKYENYINRY